MRLSPSLIGVCGGDPGVDLGTDRTVLSAHGGELVIAAPSMVAVDTRTGATLAAGSEALELLGRQGTTAIRPIKDGAIVDLERTAELLRHLIAKVERYRRSRSRVVASVPSGISAPQRRAVVDACLAAGPREARLIARPIAAALGCGLPVHEPIGSMVLDIGADRCEAAMISMRAIVTPQSIRVGSHEFDRRIVAQLRRTHQLLIGEHAVQHIKDQVDSPRPDPHAAHIDIAGQDLATGTLRSVRLTNHEIRTLLNTPITRIIEATIDTLARTPPQLAADAIDRGITLTGNESLLPGIAQQISLATGTPTHIADSTGRCAAIGAAKSFENSERCWRSTLRAYRQSHRGDDVTLTVRQHRDTLCEQPCSLIAVLQRRAGR